MGLILNYPVPKGTLFLKSYWDMPMYLIRKKGTKEYLFPAESKSSKLTFQFFQNIHSPLPWSGALMWETKESALAAIETSDDPVNARILCEVVLVQDLLRELGITSKSMFKKYVDLNNLRFPTQELKKEEPK